MESLGEKEGKWGCLHECLMPFPQQQQYASAFHCISAVHFSLEERSCRPNCWSDGGWELVSEGAEAGGAHPGAACGYGKGASISAFGILWLNENSGG